MAPPFGSPPMAVYPEISPAAMVSPSIAAAQASPQKSRTAPSTFAPLEDGFQDYMRMMNQWYDEGLIYADFLNQGSSDYPANELFTGDKIGVWFTYVSYLEAEQSLMENGVIAPIAWPSLEKGAACEYGKAPNKLPCRRHGAHSLSPLQVTTFRCCARSSTSSTPKTAMTSATGA